MEETSSAVPGLSPNYGLVSHLYMFAEAAGEIADSLVASSSRPVSADFADKVGTIEVVILRCDYSYISTPRNDHVADKSHDFALKSDHKATKKGLVTKPKRVSDTRSTSDLFGVLGWDGAAQSGFDETSLSWPLKWHYDGHADEASHMQPRHWPRNEARAPESRSPRNDRLSFGRHRVHGSGASPDRLRSLSFTSNLQKKHGSHHLPSAEDRYLQCLHTIEEIFDEIQSSLSTHMREMDDTIDRIGSALRDAQRHAPTLTHDLQSCLEDAGREKDMLIQKVLDRLETALGYMSMLDHVEWTICRDFIVDKCWLQEDHPCLVRSVSASGRQDAKRARSQVEPHGNSDAHHADKNGVRVWHEETPQRDRTNVPWQNQNAAPQSVGTRTVINHKSSEGQPQEAHSKAAEHGWSEEHVDRTWNNTGMYEQTPNHGEQGQNGWQNNDQSKSSAKAGHSNDGTSEAESKSRAKAYQHLATHEPNRDEPRRIIKAYWKDSIHKGLHGMEHSKWPTLRHDPYTYPAEPPPAVSKGTLRKVTLGVQIGKGVDYCHQTGTPEYIDTLHDPYAIFTFKYRNKKELQKMLGRSVDSDVEELNDLARKQNFMKLSREELIQELLLHDKRSRTVDQMENRKDFDEYGWGTNGAGNADEDKRSLRSNKNGSKRGGSDVSKKPQPQAAGWNDADQRQSAKGSTKNETTKNSGPW